LDFGKKKGTAALAASMMLFFPNSQKAVIVMSFGSHSSGLTGVNDLPTHSQPSILPMRRKITGRAWISHINDIKVTLFLNGRARFGERTPGEGMRYIHIYIT